MNRPIKFRVWREEYKCLEYFDLFRAEMYAADGPIMQYTCLKDKNGKDVYEGDIIEFDKYEWYQSHIRSKLDIDLLPDHIEVIEISHEGVSRSKSDLEQYCTIIGNIYQNPELLEHKCST